VNWTRSTTSRQRGNGSTRSSRASDTLNAAEAALGRVYELDLALLQRVDAVLAASADAKAVTARIDEIDADLARRDAILSGIS
jgi:hypothetical protein